MRYSWRLMAVLRQELAELEAELNADGPQYRRLRALQSLIETYKTDQSGAAEEVPAAEAAGLESLMPLGSAGTLTLPSEQPSNALPTHGGRVR